MTAATDGALLLDAILADPADDLVRLAYADHLEEDGQAGRAEFIRVQIELAGHATPNHPGVVVCEGEGPPARAGSRKRCRCRPCALLARGRDLLLWSPRPGVAAPAWREWVGPALRLVPTGALLGAHVTFRRGFVEAVRCPLDQWREHGPAVVRAHPVTALSLTGRKPWAGRDHVEPDGTPESVAVDLFGWWGEGVHYDLEAWTVPAGMMRVLAKDPRRRPTDMPYDDEGRGCVTFDSPELALEALFDAALAWANLEEGER